MYYFRNHRSSKLDSVSLSSPTLTPRLTDDKSKKIRFQVAAEFVLWARLLCHCYILPRIVLVSIRGCRRAGGALCGPNRLRDNLIQSVAEATISFLLTHIPSLFDLRIPQLPGCPKLLEFELCLQLEQFQR